MYDFDKVIDRRNTNSVKWDILSKEGKDSEGIIPMWVADMDFCVAPAITEEMQKVIDRQIYGYQFNDDEYAETIVSWMHKRHHYDIEKDSILSVHRMLFQVCARQLELYLSREMRLLFRHRCMVRFIQVLRIMTV